MNATATQTQQLRKHTTVDMDLVNLAIGNRLRRTAALRLERAGLAMTGAHDQPVQITPKGWRVLRGQERLT